MVGAAVAVAQGAEGSERVRQAVTEAVARAGVVPMARQAHLAATASPEATPAAAVTSEGAEAKVVREAKAAVDLEVAAQREANAVAKAARVESEAIRAAAESRTRRGAKHFLRSWPP